MELESAQDQREAFLFAGKKKKKKKKKGSKILKCDWSFDNSKWLSLKILLSRDNTWLQMTHFEGLQYSGRVWE